jgi:hypothetical protein
LKGKAVIGKLASATAKTLGRTLFCLAALDAYVEFGLAGFRGVVLSARRLLLAALLAGVRCLGSRRCRHREAAGTEHENEYDGDGSHDGLPPWI